VLPREAAFLHGVDCREDTGFTLVLGGGEILVWVLDSGSDLGFLVDRGWK